MGDGLAIHKHLTALSPQSVVIIGGGYIGLEMADALTQRGMAVTVLKYLESVTSTVDPGFGQFIGAELRRHGVEVVNRLKSNGNLGYTIPLRFIWEVNSSCLRTGWSSLAVMQRE